MPENDTAQCQQCGKDFKRKTFWQKFCSDTCRNKHWTDELREARAEMKRRREQGVSNESVS